jgi:hypothetical protein
MSNRKTIAVYCTNHTEYMSTVRGRRKELAITKYLYTSVINQQALKDFGRGTSLL